MRRNAAAAHITARTTENPPSADRERFREIAETELLNLHEGNYARYRIRPAEFAAWLDVWAGLSASAEVGDRQCTGNR